MLAEPSPSQERNYSITELETLAVVWSVSHFKAYLYGHEVTVYSDHSAVKAVLETPNPSGKHARWWMKVFGSGIKTINIVYRAGKENANADALSRNPTGPTPPVAEFEQVQVASVQATIPQLLQASPETVSQTLQPTDTSVQSDFAREQRNDSELVLLINFLIDDKLPNDEQKAHRIAAQALHFSVIDDILFFVVTKNGGQKRCAVPKHLCDQVMTENHSSPMAGHFAGGKLYKSLCRHWWWPRMYSDVVEFCRSCPQCLIVNSYGRVLYTLYLSKDHFKYSGWILWICHLPGPVASTWSYFKIS